jgi:hypothetical protein
MLAESNFRYDAWENFHDPAFYVLPELNLNLPKPIDKYTPGQTSWGKDIKRGLAIQRARSAKARVKNGDFFLSDVLPLIKANLNSSAWLELSKVFPNMRVQFLNNGGFVRYVLGERSSLIHPIFEPKKIEQAKAMGATIGEL